MNIKKSQYFLFCQCPLVLDRYPRPNCTQLSQTDSYFLTKLGLLLCSISFDMCFLILFILYILFQRHRLPEHPNVLLRNGNHLVMVLMGYSWWFVVFIVESIRLSVMFQKKHISAVAKKWVSDYLML